MNQKLNEKSRFFEHSSERATWKRLLFSDLSTRAEVEKETGSSDKNVCLSTRTKTDDLETCERFSYQIWALERKLNKRRVLSELNIIISDSWRFYEFTVSKSKICEWSVWIEDLWMIKLNRELYEWIETEDFMNASCQNRRFVKYQAESKALWMSRNRRFVNYQAESKWRFYEWIVSKSQICELSSWIESEDFMNKSCQNSWFLAENFKIEIIKEWYWLKMSSFESFKIEVEEKRKILVWEFQDRNQRKTNSSSW